MADTQMPPPGLQGAYQPRGESRISQYAARLRDLEREKQPWLNHYQSLAEIFHSRKADFTRAGNLGEFLQDNIFDNTPQFAAHVFASVCLSLLWPDAARSFNLVPAPQLKGVPQVEAYFKAATARLHMSMDRPEAGLQLALMEHFLDQGVFGTSGVATLDGPDADELSLPVVYEAWDVKTMFISENARGYVDTVFIKLEKTVRQIVQEYGSGRPGDKIASRVQELYDASKYDEKVEVVKVLEPKSPVRGKKGVLAMPYRSCHIDMENRTIMREGGFEELPVAIARMLKRAGEVQGRSFGMVALPAAINLNNISEGIIIGAEKQLSPPIYVLDDGRLGGTIVDTSADGMTVFNTSGRPFGEKPIGTISTVGDMTSSKDLKEQLIQEIMQAFMLDRLLDLNNKTMMTAYETSVRNRLRGESTGSIFARQIMEVLTPTIRRTFNIHYRKGFLGDFPGVPHDAPGARQRRQWKSIGGKDDMIVPDIIKKAVDAGLDIYDIEYISPAQRFMQAEKLQGMMTSMDAKIAVAAIRPDILDGTDLDLWARGVDKYSGAPNESQRTLDQVKEVRAAAASRQNAVDGLQAGAQLADMQLKSAQARQAMGTVAK